jgi:fosfomycin resistance protein FosX
MIEGLSHLTFIVRDLEKMSAVIVGVLGGREIYSSGDATFSTSREKFFPGPWNLARGHGRRAAAVEKL